MIEYIDIKKLGFKKETSKDDVYENRYGREYFWMSYMFTVNSNEITFNWDCDSLKIDVFKNGTKKIKSFDDYDEFIEFFEIFK